MSTFTVTNINKKVKTAIFKKIDALNRLSLDGTQGGDNFFQQTTNVSTALEPKDTSNPVGHQLVRNVFARAQADIIDKNSPDESVEQLAGYMKGDVLDGSLKQGLRPISFNKSPFNDDKNYIWRGASGITGIEVQQQTYFVKTIVLNWECPDPVEFEERFLKKLLKHGRFFVVEFGWGIDEKQIEAELRGTLDLDSIAFMTEITNQRNTNYAGSYQIETGIVQSYTYKMTAQGGYNGSITLISRGANVLKTPLTDGDDQTSQPDTFANSKPQIKNTGNKEEQLAEFYKAEKGFKQIIDVLPDVVELFLKDVKEEELSLKTPTIELQNPRPGQPRIQTLGQSFVQEKLNTQPEPIKVKFKNGAMKYSKGGKYKLDKGYLVTWGWFEDHILNSFFQVTAETKEKGTQILQQFRSVHKETEEERATSKNDEGTIVANKCNNNKNLDSLGLSSIILPGSNFDRENSLDKTVDDILQYIAENFGKLESTGNESAEKRILEDYYRYQMLRELKTFINGKFNKFGVYKESDSYGYIRNMVFNIEYIKEKFQSITNVQEGIKNMWDAVESDYDGFFNFDLQIDFDNNGNIGVIDYNHMGDIEKRIDLKDEDKKITYEKYKQELKENLPDDFDSIFTFSLNSKNSIIQDFDLNLKLSAEAATLATYGNHKLSTDGSLTAAGQTKDLSTERYNQFMSQGQYKDKSPVSQSLDTENNKVESLVVNKLSIPMSDGQGTAVDEYEVAEGGSQKVNKLNDNGINFKELNSYLTTLKEIEDEIDEDIAEIDEDDFGEELKEGIKTINKNAKFNLKGESKTGSFRNTLFRANKSPIKEDYSNYRMLNVAIPIELSMTLDGIGGLRPGNMFLVDYLPKFYRKYAYFCITKVNHSISSAGWTTSVDAIMRLNTFNMLEDGLIVDIKEEELKKKRQEEISKDFESQGGLTNPNLQVNLSLTGGSSNTQSNLGLNVIPSSLG